MFKPAPKNVASAAKLAAEHEELQHALAAKEVEKVQLEGGLAAAELAGEEAIEAHEQKVKALDRQLRSLRAQLQDVAQKCEAAERRELTEGVIARRKRAMGNTTRLAPEYEKMHDEQKRHCELLTRAKHQQSENDEVNRLIRQHQLDVEPVPHVEYWRAEQATAAVYEEVKVQKDVHVAAAQIAGPDMVVVRSSIPGTIERRTEIERRLVSAAKPGFVPRPLWDCFALPGLRRDDPSLIVPGTRGRPWWV